MSAGHEAMPVVMSWKNSSVMLVTMPTHASDAHVAVVRGLSLTPSSLSVALSSDSARLRPRPWLSGSPHEDISSPILEVAPPHVLSENGVRAEVRPHSEAVLSTLILRKPASMSCKAAPGVVRHAGHEAHARSRRASGRGAGRAITAAAAATAATAATGGRTYGRPALAAGIVILAAAGCGALRWSEPLVLAGLFTSLGLLAARGGHLADLGRRAQARIERERSEGRGQAARVESGEERLGQQLGRVDSRHVGKRSSTRCQARDHVLHHRPHEDIPPILATAPMHDVEGVAETEPGPEIRPLLEIDTPGIRLLQAETAA
eukprot:scaffold33297_cov53-Phaeocystis_antarctica.AAC.2